MKKIIKQDMTILLSLMASFHPAAAADIEREAKKLTMQDTRDYLFLLRDGQCRIFPFADVFHPGSEEYGFFLSPAEDGETARVMHLHLTRVARDSPEGSAVAVDYEAMRRSVESVSALRDEERSPEINMLIHRSLTRARLCSTQDFTDWLKGGQMTWR